MILSIEERVERLETDKRATEIVLTLLNLGLLVVLLIRRHHGV